MYKHLSAVVHICERAYMRVQEQSLCQDIILTMAAFPVKVLLKANDAD